MDISSFSLTHSGKDSASSSQPTAAGIPSPPGLFCWLCCYFLSMFEPRFRVLDKFIFCGESSSRFNMPKNSIPKEAACRIIYDNLVLDGDLG
ncbi:hypothetical protein DKX38_027480 [Salix brachista]|uniref:Uncharacterized protein n=1 Tax=Salix brachista TaxID=2182728 RepID=A0A5N5JCY8_9ROSI|nr:hypothetical protein DKX38_027480 [Salix brachista]